MRGILGLLAISVSAVVAISRFAWGSDGSTVGGNPQRTNWQQDETLLSKENVANLKILWKLKFDNAPRQMHSLFPPLIVGQVNTTIGSKQIGLQHGTDAQPTLNAPEARPRRR